MLEEMKEAGKIDRLILLDRNLGYAGGNNKGLEAATGAYVIFINSDVIVSPNWLSKLTHHLEDKTIGAVGPVSNNVGSRSFPQRVRYQNEKAGKLFELRRISGFCIAFSKQCLETVGRWDERFYPGNFDDDDMSVRLTRAGLKLICDGDVFVHHKMMTTFKSNPNLQLDKTFFENKLRFEAKWPDEPAIIAYPESKW
jgi:GT2 family glycosyltransferase